MRQAERLMRDLRAVTDDVDELVKAAAGTTDEAFLDARARIARSLNTAKETLRNAGRSAIDEADAIARSTDDYVRENPWQSIGIAGAIGFLLGALVLSRSRRYR